MMWSFEDDTSAIGVLCFTGQPLNNKDYEKNYILIQIKFLKYWL